MNKFYKFILSLIIAFTFLITLTPAKIKAITADQNGNWYWGYQTQLNESYYQDLIGITNQTEFTTTLSEIISTGVKKITYGSSGTRAALEYIDEAPDDSSKIKCFYTAVNYAKNASSSTWNQEHTWAKSHGFPSSSKYAYCDLNHLRTTQNNINSTRGNKGFKEVNGNNTASGDWFEPADWVKGDVARIMMYMDVRYDGGINTNGVTLTLVNGSTSTSDGTGQFGDKATLLRWHVEDPVDDWERRRNDRVFEKQGNRNPFIDHPEYADIIYGTNYAENHPTTPDFPMPEVKYSVNYYLPSGVSFDYQDTNEYSINSLINEPMILPVKAGYEFVGWYTNSSLTTQWDFKTDRINGNLTLYPKFNKLDNPIEEFKNIDINGKLAVDATYESNDNYISDTMILAPMDGPGVLTVEANQTFTMDDYFYHDNTMFAISYHTNDKAAAYINSTEIRLYNANGNGGAIQIAALGNFKITSISFTSNNDSNLTATISNNQKTAIIQNISNTSSGNVKLYSINVSYETADVDYQINHAYLAYRYQINQTLLTKLQALDANLSLGIRINDNHYALNLENNEIIYNLVEVNLSDEYAVSGYIIINGEYYYTTIETYSVKMLANRYLNEMKNDDTVTAHIGLLQYLAR